jgi:hypothetical protein
MARRIAEKHGIEPAEAGQILDATVQFLLLCAEHPRQRFAPSKRVDLGWHTFILYTKDYHAFCLAHAGRYIHHQPNDGVGTHAAHKNSRDTVEFMRRNGIQFDAKMWGLEGADCEGDVCIGCSVA